MWLTLAHSLSRSLALSHTHTHDQSNTLVSLQVVTHPSCRVEKRWSKWCMAICSICSAGLFFDFYLFCPPRPSHSEKCVNPRHNPFRRPDSGIGGCKYPVTIIWWISLNAVTICAKKSTDSILISRKSESSRLKRMVMTFVLNISACYYSRVCDCAKSKSFSLPSRPSPLNHSERSSLGHFRVVLFQFWRPQKWLGFTFTTPDIMKSSKCAGKSFSLLYQEYDCV